MLGEQILVVDDQPLICKTLSRILRQKGYEVDSASDGTKALEKLKTGKFSVVITDLKMPGLDGMDVLKETKRFSPSTPVVMMTAYGTVENAVEAMKEGAFHYISKPFSQKQIDSVLEKIIDNKAKQENALRGIVASDPKMLRVLEMVKTVANTQATVLIQGESGTGKELVAEAVHRISPRSEGPFIVVNCAALPETLVESELFGYEKGAFTGALARKMGKFELANGGTLLLDEISEIKLSIQAKLLRVLQEKKVDRVGGTKPIEVDVRVIATTNRVLEKEIKEGNFREDLFYRLNVFPIRLPSLRERPGDIEPLVRHFLMKSCRRENKSIENVSQDALRLLLTYNWPGNVRELGNVIERGTILCKDRVLSSEYLFLHPEDGDSTTRWILLQVGTSLREVEEMLILRTLAETNGNRTKAAQLLGVTARTIRNKLHEYQREENFS